MNKLLNRVVIAVVLLGGIALGVWSYLYAPVPTRIRHLAHQLAQSDPAAQRQALKRLQRMGERAMPTLQRMLSHRNSSFRQAAAHAMASLETREQAARKALQDALHDNDWRVRKMAAHALGQQGWYSASAVHALASALMREKEWQVRREIAQALGQIGPAARQAVPALSRKLQDADWSVRTAALRALARIELSARDLVAHLEQTLQDKRWQVRELAAQLSTQAGLDAGPLVPLLQTATKSARQEVRSAASTALRQLGQDVLAQALLRPRSSRAHEAMRALERWSRSSRLLLQSVLEGLLQEGFTGQQTLLQLLQKVQPTPASPPSMARLYQRNEMYQAAIRIRTAIVLQLPQLGALATLALPVLRDMMQSPEADDRWAAAHTMAQLPPALPTLRDLLNHKQRWVQRAAVQAAQVLGSKAVLVMVEASSHRDPVVRLRAVRSLGQSQPHSAVSIPPLVERVTDSYTDVRVAAVRSLLRLGAAGRNALLSRLKTMSLPQLSNLLAQAPDLPAMSLSPRRRGQLLSALLRTLRTGDTAARVRAVRSLIPLAQDAAPLLPELRSLLFQHKSPMIKQVTAQTLAVLGQHLPGAVSVLRQALRRSSEALQRLALQALRQLGPKASPALPELLRALKNLNTRRLALATLRKLGPSVLPALRARYQSNDPRIRWALVEVAAAQKPQTAKTQAFLQKAAKDPAAMVRLVAQRALQSTPPIQSTPPTTRPTPSPTTRPTTRPAIP